MTIIIILSTTAITYTQVWIITPFVCFAAWNLLSAPNRMAYSHWHNALRNGFFKTYLVMFQQDPRCHTKPVFGCLERAKVAAGEVCHLLWMPLLIIWGQDAIQHTFWVAGCYSGRTRASVWAWARGNVFGSVIFVTLPNTTKQASDNFVVQSIMQTTVTL